MDRSEPYEALYRFFDTYVYVQHLADDPEYDFDYTLYDMDFEGIDGGVIGEAGCAVEFGGTWNNLRAAKEALLLYGTPVFDDSELEPLDPEEYRDLLE